MRAGNLDREIQITRTTTAPNPDEPWVPGEPTTEVFATVRAQVVQQGTDEFMANYGEGQRTITVFRIRWLAGVELTDQVLYEGRTFDLKEIKEIGRRKGIELRAEAVT